MGQSSKSKKFGKGGKAKDKKQQPQEAEGKESGGEGNVHPPLHPPHETVVEGKESGGEGNAHPPHETSAPAPVAASGAPDVAPSASSSSMPGVAAASSSSSSMSMIPNLASSIPLARKRGKRRDSVGQKLKETPDGAEIGKGKDESGEPDTEPLLPTGPSSDISGEGQSADENEVGGCDESAPAAARARTVEKNDSQDADDERVDSVKLLVSSFERLSFERLVQGWEAIVGAGSKDAQAAGQFRPYPMTERTSSNDSLSSSRRSELLLQPIHFKHTHSSPIRYTRFYDEDDDCEDAAPMKRSSSTPSPFRHNSLASAFSQPLQRRSYAAMSDPGVYHSAFDPVLSTFQGKTTDADNKASQAGGEEEDPEEEEEDSKPAALPTEGKADVVSSQKPRRASKLRASKRFLSDVKTLRKRRFRSGRENPARPPSSSSSSTKDSDNAQKDKGREVAVAAAETTSIQPASPAEKGAPTLDTETKPGKEAEATAASHHEATQPTRSLIDLESSIDEENDEEDDVAREVGESIPAGHHTRSLIDLESSIEEGNDGGEDDIAREVGGSVPAVRHYESLDSEDIEDESDGRPGSIETALTSASSPALPVSSSTVLGQPGHAESPTPIPSPAYQQFVDEIPEDAEVSGDGDLHFERIVRTPPHPSPAPASRLAAVTPQPRYVMQGESPQGSNLSPSSHGSASNSRTTSQSQNTLSQRMSTSMSETMSSGQTVTSSVAEADREVMEANRRERIRREAVVVDIDGTASVHSASTASTNPTAYIALTSSPVAMREGARIPVDRFFGAAIPMTNSSSSNTGGSGESLQSGPPVVASSAKKKTFSPSGLVCGVGVGVGTSSPTSVSSSSVANTNSSSSTSEEPPRLVAYLDKQTKSKLKTTSPTRPAPRAVAPEPLIESAEESEERESPAPIIGYSKLGSEEATGLLQPKSQHPKVVRPVKKSEKVKKWIARSKPPRSPAKMDGRARTPTPTIGQSSSGSIGGTPPRRIIDARGPHDFKSRTGVTRPKIFRSGAEVTSGRTVLLSSSSSGSGRDTPAGEIKTTVGAEADDGAQEVFTTGSTAISAVSPESHRIGSAAVEFEDDDLPFDERNSYLEELRKQNSATADVGDTEEEGEQGMPKSTDAEKKSAVITPEKSSEAGA